ncbi:hypothetical protein bcgnr5379_60760 [Bacillus cereus]|uniref:HTH OST-type domain-containing protein n=1 Tax=Lysobacter enzymogenes TaxID=69 RepID=A0AAU9AAI7_LYSEN|nr:NYN domain-containing protein [Lysobacter enzymogenes]BAV95730.1 conserved hypothetical protein [Lysobacter enzymogenes]
MSASHSHFDGRVAVLVDCDNVSPDILDYALLMAAQFGRVVLRRGYGNSSTLGSKWQDALVRQAFTPHLQFQYASGKNTADIALALDALEAMFDERAQTFCLVTSDSDFAYLCRKLRERGATVCIVGEAKAPEALRNASDQFFEWVRETPGESTSGDRGYDHTAKVESASRAEVIRADMTKPTPRRRPRFVVDAVELLAGAMPDGKVTLSGLGLYLRRTDPAFSPQAYGHSGLLNMLKGYDLLVLKQEEGSHWSVSPKPQ